jgi:hypothetical protein
MEVFKQYTNTYNKYRFTELLGTGRRFLILDFALCLEQVSGYIFSVVDPDS